MPCSRSLYPLVLRWVKALGVASHATGAEALATLLSAVLVSQSLRPAALVRTLLSPPAVPARQRYKRVARLLDMPWLTPAHVTAALVPAALALYAEEPPLLALDSVRCGGWECFTVSLVLPGRVQLLASASMPFPWPKHQYGRQVELLLRQVAQAWPATAPRPQLVADRGFPSTELFRLLAQLRFDYTIRLRATMAVTLGDGRVCTVRELLATADPASWQMRGCHYGQGRKAVAGRLLIGQGLTVLRWHQRDDGSARGRQRRGRQRASNAGYRRVDRPSAAASTDAWVVLFTTCATELLAVRSYARRYHTEASYRDLQGGWDGRHGWELEQLLAAQRSAAAVDTQLSLAMLAQLLQQWLGAGVGKPGAARWYAQRLTVHGRLSLFARGQALLREADPAIQAWLGERLAAGAARLERQPRLLKAVVRPPRLQERERLATAA
jgi:hypothetical protein